MKLQKILKLLGFNFTFMISEIILFSRAISYGADPVVDIAVVLLSAAAFFGFNYMILNKQPQGNSEKVKTIHDYREALASWRGKHNPFNYELREAVYQLDTFEQKQNTLRTLLGEDAKEPANPFMNISHDVEECLLSNAHKFLNRMMILDPRDQSRFPMHNEYLHKLLIQNRQLLSQYDNLIIEISQIGNSREMENLHLDSIAETLRELRNEDENATMGEYGAAMLMQQNGWESY